MPETENVGERNALDIGHVMANQLCGMATHHERGGCGWSVDARDGEIFHPDGRPG